MSQLSTTKPLVGLLAPLPSDLKTALADNYTLVPADIESAGDYNSEISAVVTTAMHGFNATDIAHLPELKLVLSQGVGLEKLDFETAKSKSIAISVTPNILTEDVADFAIGLVYAAARKIAVADRFVRANRWGTERMTPSLSLFGKTMGIVGLGHIGRAIARRAVGIDMSIAYSGPRRKSDLDYEFIASVETLAAQSDVLVFACPGGPQTAKICNQAVLENLGTSGVLINISRGSVVDEEALLDALENNKIFGAGLDVFTSEPKLNPRFLSLDNVVLTPHSASVTREVRGKLIACMLEDAKAFFSKKPLKHTVEM